MMAGECLIMIIDFGKEKKLNEPQAHLSPHLRSLALLKLIFDDN
jgi:hypothetical protein